MFDARVFGIKDHGENGGKTERQQVRTVQEERKKKGQPWMEA